MIEFFAIVAVETVHLIFWWLSNHTRTRFRDFKSWAWDRFISVLIDLIILIRINDDSDFFISCCITENSSRLDLLFTSLSVWFVYLHILTNSCRSMTLYNSVARIFCNSYDILSFRFSKRAFWLYSSKSLINRWNSTQNVLKFLNDSICLRRLYVFNALMRRFESSNIWYKSSKISSAIVYDLIEFLKNRKIKCFMTSSSILIRTYAFCWTSVEN
jgi:hypothetical protein